MLESAKFCLDAWVAWGMKRLIERLPLATDRALDMAKVLFEHDDCLTDLRGEAVYRIVYTPASDEFLVTSRYGQHGTYTCPAEAWAGLLRHAKRSGYRMVHKDG